MTHRDWLLTWCRLNAEDVRQPGAFFVNLVAIPKNLNFYPGNIKWRSNHDSCDECTFAAHKFVLIAGEVLSSVVQLFRVPSVLHN